MSKNVLCIMIIFNYIVHRRNVKYFGRVFLMLNYTDITQNTYPKLNGYGDNGQRILKLWQLLHTYWLPNTYWKWQEYVVSVMLISKLNIKVTCEWHKAIKLNYKNTRSTAAVVLGFQALCISGSNKVLSYRVGRSSFAVKLANVRSSRSHVTTGRGGCIAL